MLTGNFQQIEKVDIENDLNIMGSFKIEGGEGSPKRQEERGGIHRYLKDGFKNHKEVRL